MKKQASKKNRMTLILLLAVLLAGLSLLLYPMVADYWNSMHQSQAIASYQETVAEMDDETYEALWQAAEDYNSGLLGNADRFQPTQEEHQRYEELLNVSGSGVMGYVCGDSQHRCLPAHLPRHQRGGAASGGGPH